MANILLIDDDASVRVMLGRSLERAGHCVTGAADGTEGLRAFRDASYDAIVTDIIMPGIEGIATIRAFRAEDGAIPIIAMTGGSDASARLLEPATQFGATATLTKPFSAKDLVALITRLLPNGRSDSGDDSGPSATPSAHK